MSYWIHTEFIFNVGNNNITLPTLFEYKGKEIEWAEEQLEKYFDYFFKDVPHREYNVSLSYNRKKLIINLSIRCEQSTENALGQYMELIENIAENLCQDVPMNLRMHGTRLLDFSLKLKGGYFLGGGLNFEMNLESDIKRYKNNAFKLRIDGYGIANNQMIRWKKFWNKYVKEGKNISKLLTNKKSNG